MSDTVAKLADARLIELPHHVAPTGELVVLEGSGVVPFQIARVFFVHAPAGATRGQHAHKRCSQFMLACAGRVEVICDDGNETATFHLTHRRAGLLVPPGIWATQKYLAPGSGLAVLCDRRYEADDYLRDYAEFKVHRAQGTTNGRPGGVL
jgi:hypothetical protein